MSILTATTAAAKSADAIILNTIDSFRLCSYEAISITIEHLSDREKRAINARLLQMGCPKLNRIITFSVRFKEFIRECARGCPVSFPEPTPAVEVETPAPKGWDAIEADDTPAPVSGGSPAATPAVEMQVAERVEVAREIAREIIRARSSTPEQRLARWYVRVEGMLSGIVTVALEVERKWRDRGESTDNLVKMSARAWARMTDDEQADFAAWCSALDYRPGEVNYGPLALDEMFDVFVIECLEGTPIFPVYFPPSGDDSDSSTRYNTDGQGTVNPSPILNTTGFWEPRHVVRESYSVGRVPSSSGVSALSSGERRIGLEADGQTLSQETGQAVVEANEPSSATGRLRVCRGDSTAEREVLHEESSPGCAGGVCRTLPSGDGMPSRAGSSEGQQQPIQPPVGNQAGERLRRGDSRENDPGIEVEPSEIDRGRYPADAWACVSRHYASCNRQTVRGVHHHRQENPGSGKMDARPLTAAYVQERFKGGFQLVPALSLAPLVVTFHGVGHPFHQADATPSPGFPVAPVPRVSSPVLRLSDPLPGVSSPETIEIHGTLYGLERTVGGFTLEKRDGTLHEVAIGLHGHASCTCPDFRFRHAGLPTQGCRHVRGLRSVGLIPAQHAADTPTVEMQPTTPEEVHLMARMESMGIPPVCGGSEEAKPEHTPGPWHAEVLGCVGKRYEAGGQRTICTSPHYPTREDEANLRLIAAAPDLLEACRSALELILTHNQNHHEGMADGHLWKAANSMREAIAKAAS